MPIDVVEETETKYVCLGCYFVCRVHKFSFFCESNLGKLAHHLATGVGPVSYQCQLPRGIARAVFQVGELVVVGIFGCKRRYFPRKMRSRRGDVFLFGALKERGKQHASIDQFRRQTAQTKSDVIQG